MKGGYGYVTTTFPSTLLFFFLNYGRLITSGCWIYHVCLIVTIHTKLSCSMYCYCKLEMSCYKSFISPVEMSKNVRLPMTIVVFHYKYLKKKERIRWPMYDGISTIVDQRSVSRYQYTQYLSFRVMQISNRAKIYF